MSDTLNIVFVTNHFLPRIGGVELSVHCTAVELSKRGHKVTIITEGDDTPEVESSEYDVIRFSVPVMYPITRLWYWKRMWQLRQVFRTADVVHFHDYITLIHWYFPLRLLIHSPVYAITFHGFESWPILFRYQLFRMVASRLCRVVFGVGKYLETYYAHEIDEYYVGAAVRSFEKHNSIKINHISYVGRLEPDTQIYDVLKQLRRYSEQRMQPLYITLVGEGSQAALIKRMCSEYFAVQIQKPTLDIEHICRDSGTIVATGFLSIMDAIASGKHVIIPAFTKFRQDYVHSIEGIERASFVVTSEDDFHRTLDHILERTEVAAEKLQAASAILRDNTWMKIVDFHESYYAHFISSRNADNLL